MPHNNVPSKLNTECSMMKFGKGSLGKRFSKFLSKMFWHFDQPIPDYSSVNRRRRISNDKCVLNSNRNQQSIDDTDPNRISNGTRYRRTSIIHRTSTLTSIKEENEVELMNCK